MEIVIQQLLERLEIQGRKKVKNFPFLMGQGVWIGSENLSWRIRWRKSSSRER